MSSKHQPPHQSGAPCGANKPQVLVRAGKTYVCSACGTLVEIPADIVGQLVIAVDPVPPEDPAPVPAEASDVPATEVSNEESPHAVVEQRPTLLASEKKRPSRPRSPRKPARELLAGETIDGLRVPTAQELDRALAWVSFHLKVLDRQGSELQRLQKLRKKQAEPCPRSHGHAAEKNVAPFPNGSVAEANPVHAEQDVSVIPTMKTTKGREPP